MSNTKGRRGKTRLWSQDQMEEAIKKVRDGEMTDYQAHKTYGIPKQTLSDRLTAR